MVTAPQRLCRVWPLQERRSCLPAAVLLAALFLPVALLLPAGTANGQMGSGPSAFCHVTDGQFTVCPGGGTEWSDVPVRAFPDSQSFLYASQADLDPTKGSPFSAADTFVLMYDECGRRSPLGPNEYFLVSFKTVEVENAAEKLEHYVIHVFTDGTIIFIEDGAVQPPGRAPVVDGMRGKVGFGPSPNCPFDHVIAEFQVPLSITGSSYSPDPLFWSASIPPPPKRGCQPGQVGVPLMVNVLKGVIVSESRIEEMVREANRILGQADVCLDFGPDNIVPGASDGGNESGTIEPQEDAGLEQACVRELAARFGGGRGYKVYLTTNIFGGTDLGTSVPLTSLPCAYVRVVDSNTTVGNTIAHEFGHVFLGRDHLVDDRGTPDPGDDIRTDADGHDRTDPNNLMFGVSQGDKLTDDQIQQLNQSARTRARNSEHGSWVDDIGDVGRPHIDLFVGSVFAPNLAGDLDAAIVVGGLHPDGTPVNSRFELLFDSDNNVATGTAIGSFAGIDKIVEIALVGRFPFVAPDGTVTATVRDAISGTTTPLTPGGVQRLPRILDSRDPSRPPSSFDFADAIQQKIPLPVLGLSAGQVPVGIRAISVDSGEVDEASFLFTLSLTPGLRAIRPGFNASTLPGNDDESSGFVPLGFSANFFGTSFTGLFVNNNGNVTFDSPLEEFTPFGLTASNRIIIAPYFADVDTRQGNVVTFGAGTVNGRPAFGVNWPGVGCFDETTSVLNFFQVLLVDRSDVAPGDFDIEFNYDSIQWEAGQASGGDDLCQGGDAARVGFSNGTGVAGTFFELTGSGIPGAFLDANTVTGLIHNSLNSSQPGRYAFSVRSGVPVVEDGDGDGVADELDNCPAVANPDQADGTLNGIGDACETPGLLNSTAAFMRAGFDGRTFVEPTSLLVADEPTFLAQLVRIVDFRLDAGLSASAEGTATNLVDSLGDLNLLPPDQANALIAAILQQVTPALRGDIDGDGDVDLDDITILLRDRNKTVGASVCGPLCDLDIDGMITALDARIVVTLCTRARCATQ